MPKKRSSWGQQEYVPPGNGDASGEYANDEGSNTHFTSFKKPDDTIKGGSTEIEEPKTGFSNFGKKEESTTESIDEENFVNEQTIDDETAERMRNIIKKRIDWSTRGDTIRELENVLKEKGFDSDQASLLANDFYTANEPTLYYYKKGGKWYQTYNENINQWYGYEKVKLFTKDEYQKALAKQVEKDLKLTPEDKKIKSFFGEDTIVSFGPSYNKNKEFMEELSTATETMVNDFPEMKTFMRGVGDKTALEKYSKALAETKLTPENIEKEVQKIKEKLSAMGSLNSWTDEDIKNRAIRNIKSSALSLSRGGRSWLAYWSPAQRVLVMLPKSLDHSVSEGQKSSYKSNWHSSDKSTGTYFHEFGHAVDSMIFKLYNQKREEINQRVQSGQLSEESKGEFFLLKAKYEEKISNLRQKNFNKNYGQESIKEVNKKFGTNYQNIEEFKNRPVDNWQEWLKQNDYFNTTMKTLNDRKYMLSEYGNSNRDEFVAESFSAYYTNMNNSLANETVEAIKQFYKEIKEF